MSRIGVFVCHCGENIARTVDCAKVAEALKENLLSLVAALNKVKPAASKGAFLKKVTLSTTMGPGIRLDTSGL